MERRRWGRSRGGRRDGGGRGRGCARARDGTSRSGGRRGPGPRRGTGRGRARAPERRSARRPRGSRVKILGRASSSGAGGKRQTTQARRAGAGGGATGGFIQSPPTRGGNKSRCAGECGLTSRGRGHVSARRRDEHQTTPETGWKPRGRRRWPRCGARTLREGVPCGHPRNALLARGAPQKICPTRELKSRDRRCCQPGNRLSKSLLDRSGTTPERARAGSERARRRSPLLRSLRHDRGDGLRRRSRRPARAA